MFEENDGVVERLGTIVGAIIAVTTYALLAWTVLRSFIKKNSPGFRRQGVHFLFTAGRAFSFAKRGVVERNRSVKKIIVAAMAVSLAVAFSPITASAAPRHEMMRAHHHHHCRVIKKRERHHGHWVIRNVKVCR